MCHLLPSPSWSHVGSEAKTGPKRFRSGHLQSRDAVKGCTLLIWITAVAFQLSLRSTPIALKMKLKLHHPYQSLDEGLPACLLAIISYLFAADAPATLAFCLLLKWQPHYQSVWYWIFLINCALLKSHIL